MNLNRISTVIFIVMLLVLIAAAGLLIYSFTKKSVDPEIQMGLVVVTAIAVLMAVLFIIAAGFSSMSLTDPKQALGLPEGSIRAMIALVLIMVFIIFGIYLFRKVSAGDFIYMGRMKTLPESRTIAGKPITYEGKEGDYDVWIVSEVSDDAKRLAQQLITIVGTLVVAVSSFYFGSALTRSAAKKVAASNPVIKKITPTEGIKGQQLDLEIVGTGFTSPKDIRLLRGDEAMAATDVLSNTTKIQCKVMIDKEPDGKWDVIVENGNGKQGRLAEVFTIKPA